MPLDFYVPPGFYIPQIVPISILNTAQNGHINVPVRPERTSSLQVPLRTLMYAVSFLTILYYLVRFLFF